MAVESGWAYVVGTEASGPKGSIQIAGQDTNLDHDTRLQWSEADQALIVSGNIIAKNFEIQNQSVTVFHLDVTGSSTFGDSKDDMHTFTGSVNISQDLFIAGEIYASQLNIDSANIVGIAVDSYDNQLDNHIVLGNGSKSIRTETNLSYENNTLYVTGAIQTNELSSSLGYFDALETEEALTNTLVANDTRTALLTGSNLYVGDIVLTGRVVDINGKEILRSSTAGTLSSISNSGVSQTISSNSYITLGTSNALGFEFAVIEKGLSVDNNSFYVGEDDLVGVGTNKPAKRLEVYDSSASQLRLSSIGAGQLINGGLLFTPTKKHTDLGTNTTGDFHILPTNGRVGINTTTPQHTLDIVGDLGISGDLYVSGTLHARMTDFIVSADTVTLGDESTDVVTINASTMAVPNGLTIDNQFFIKDGTIGVGAISPQAKFMIESPTDQFKVGTQTNKLSVNVSSASARLSVNSGYIDIANQTNVLGELRVGSNSNVIMNPIGTVSSSVSVSSDYGYFNNLETNTITNGNTIIGSNSVSTPSVISTSLTGQLQTAQQPKITQVGTLDFLNVSGDAGIANDLNVGSSLAVGTQSASRKVEIKDSNAQLRLTNTNEVFGISEHTYADFNVNSNGDLSLQPSSGLVIAPSLKLTNIQQGSSTSFLSLDGNGNVILAPAVDPGIEVRNRTVVENSYSIQNSDYFIGIQAKSNLTITLPDASQLQNGQIMVLKDEDEMADVFSITINARPSQSIENKSSLTFVSPGSSIMIYTDGTSRFFIM